MHTTQCSKNGQFKLAIKRLRNQSATISMQSKHIINVCSISISLYECMWNWQIQSQRGWFFPFYFAFVCVCVSLNATFRLDIKCLDNFYNMLCMRSFVHMLFHHFWFYSFLLYIFCFFFFFLSVLVFFYSQITRICNWVDRYTTIEQTYRTKCTEYYICSTSHTN